MSNPFSFNPFSNKKIDFTKNIPESPKELPDKKQPAISDDERINTINNTPVSKTETIAQKQETPQQGLPDSVV